MTEPFIKGAALKMNLLQQLKASKIIAIVRGIPAPLSDPTAEALAAGGIRFIEVTMNTDQALQIVDKWRRNFDGSVYIGAGTVLNLNMAKEAVAAGAQYLISPNLDEEVISYGVQHCVEVWPGTMTPTEICKAYQAGASAVKVFPANTLGAGYIKELQGPLGQIPMVATGGVHLDNMADYLKAGAIAVGLGGNLVDKRLISEKKFDELKNLAKRYVSIASAAGV